MWELIIQAVGYIVGGSMMGRAAAIEKKTERDTWGSQQQIAEITGESQLDAAREKTKQSLLVAYSSKVSEGKKDIPVMGISITVIVLLAVIYKINNSDGKATT